MIEDDIKTVDFSQTNLFTTDQDILKSFDIYPLQNNVNSLGGKKPLRFSIRNLSYMDKDRTFNFNTINKRYSYVVDGEELLYDLGMKNIGTIAMRFCTDCRQEKQYLFEAKDSLNHKIALYKDKFDSLVVELNGRPYTSTLECQINKWHSVALSFKDNIMSLSNPQRCLDLRIYLDGKLWTTSVELDFNFSNLELMVGRQYDTTSLFTNLGRYDTTYPLNGQIEMLSTRNAFCEVNTLNHLFEELKGITKVTEFDDLGMLRKVEVHQGEKAILSNVYEYKTRKPQVCFISKHIKSEKIKCGSKTYSRDYETDALGNVTKVSDKTFGSHSYKYDFRGFLVQADNEAFTYDNNGNILKKGNKSFVYDSLIKDRLISVDGNKIEYDPNNPLNPTKYLDKTFKFEGRRLVRVGHSNGYYEYIYNDQGLRIQKRDHRGVSWDYIYDGNKLICEKSYKCRLDFLYDEYGNLYGFIKDNTDKYLYIRDSMRNILGICDFSGKIVVK